MRVGFACSRRVAADNTGKARLPSQGKDQLACKALRLVGADANTDFGLCQSIKCVLDVSGAHRVIADVAFIMVEECQYPILDECVRRAASKV